MCSSLSAQRLVLIVEDDPEIQELLQLVLADEQIPAAHARTARAALSALAESRPTVMLLDLGLPDAAATPIASVLAAAREAGTRVIICSAAGRSVDELSSRTEGDAYLVKPFDIDDLLSVIRRLLDESCASR